MNNSIEDISNIKKIAIVVVGYNRLNSIKRLLYSLNKARYPDIDVPLVISIDCSGNEDLYDYVNQFEWRYGTKYVIIQPKRLGLKKHIFQCGDLSSFFRAVVILEDDVVVSEFFFNYVKESVDYYESDDRIGGISLYKNEISLQMLPRDFLNDGSDTYLKQTPSSWGECWTNKQWKFFKEWLEGFSIDEFNEIDMPEECKKWSRAWSIFYMAYLIQTNRYFVFPHISHTTCFGDTGEHGKSSGSVGQANLLSGPKDYLFKPFEKMVKYGIYDDNYACADWLGIDQSELCIDFYGNHERKDKRYLLTPLKRPFIIIRSFGLTMRPIELNIKYHIPGEALFLYDTSQLIGSSDKKVLPLTLASYFLRGFNYKLLRRYVVDTHWRLIKLKLYKSFHVREHK